MRLSSWAGLGCLGLGMMMVACGDSKSTNHGSTLFHNEGEPLVHTEGVLWKSLNEREYVQSIVPVISAMLESSEVKLYNENSVARQKIQSMSDEIFAALVKSRGDEMKQIPRPAVHLVEASDANAFVMPVAICTQARLLPPKNRILANSAASENRRQWENRHVMVSADGEASPSWAEGQCLDHENPNFLNAYLAWYNQHLGRECKLSLENRSELGAAVRMSDECRYSNVLNIEGSEPQFTAMVIGAAITVHTGLLEQLSEDEVRAVIAHEMAHYIKVHPLLDRDRDYNFFYAHSKIPVNQRPVADPQMQEIGNKIKNSPIPHRMLYHVPGQAYPPELFLTMASSAYAISQHPSCKEGNDNPCTRHCAKALEIINDEDFVEGVRNYPWRPLKFKLHRQYLEFENSFTACLSESDGVDAKTIEQSFAEDVRVSTLLKKIDGSQGFEKSFGQAVQRVNEFRTVMETPLKTAVELKLGYYTIEQEADELSLEYLNLAGRDPRVAVASQLRIHRMIDKLHKKVGKAPFPTSIPIERCEELLSRSWVDENGDYVFVPVADFNDSHHSGCYRIYNMDRELLAHNYNYREQQLMQDPVQPLIAGFLSTSWNSIGSYFWSTTQNYQTILKQESFRKLAQKINQCWGSAGHNVVSK